MRLEGIECFRYFKERVGDGWEFEGRCKEEMVFGYGKRENCLGKVRVYKRFWLRFCCVLGCGLDVGV